MGIWGETQPNKDKITAHRASDAQAGFCAVDAQLACFRRASNPFAGMQLKVLQTMLSVQC
jgi:hypothetical protein